MNRRQTLAGLAAATLLPGRLAAQTESTRRMDKWAYSTQGFERIVHRIDGIETVTYAIGPRDGEPLVYFHGGGTFHGFEWVRPLADRFRVYSPYHPNFGESADAPFDQMADYVQHYEMLFPALGLDTFHLAGASMGGHMAARYAAANPDDIDKLVLISAAGLKSERTQVGNFAGVAPEDIRFQFVTDRAWIEPFWPTHPSPEWQVLRDREQRAAFASREDADATDRALRTGLKGFERPVLLLWGELDHVVPLPMAQDWLEVLPDAELVVIPGGSHLLPDEFPAAVTALRAFLEA